MLVWSSSDLRVKDLGLSLQDCWFECFDCLLVSFIQLGPRCPFVLNQCKFYCSIQVGELQKRSMCGWISLRNKIAFWRKWKAKIWECYLTRVWYPSIFSVSVDAFRNSIWRLLSALSVYFRRAPLATGFKVINLSEVGSDSTFFLTLLKEWATRGCAVVF